MEDKLNTLENPFIHNYVFKKTDLLRAKIKWQDRLFLWLKPTYVQCSEGYAWYFKRGRHGRVYVMKCENLLQPSRRTR